jgi:DNA primase
MGLCPFHKEKTPSFSVNPDRGLYHCFGCGESGNAYTFVMKKEGLNFTEAVERLARRAGVSLPEKELSRGEKEEQAKKEEIYRVNKAAARFFYDNLKTEEGAGACAYMDGRGLSKNARIRFGLGYSSNNWDLLRKKLKSDGFSDDILLSAGLITRSKSGFIDKFRGRLMFPIFDSQGRVAGFGGRDLTGQEAAKYMNSPDTPVFDKSRNLYAINFAKKAAKGEFILTEGYMDAIAMYSAGFAETVASLGTAFNEKHAGLIRRWAKKVTLLFDSDGAGVKAAERAIPILEGAGVSVKVLLLGGAKDPDEFLGKYGPRAMREALGGAESSVSFIISRVMEKHDISSAAGKVDFVNEAAAFLSGRSPIERSVHIKELSEKLRLPAEGIAAEVETRAAKEGAPPARPPKTQLYAPQARPERYITASGALLRVMAENPDFAVIAAAELTPEYMPTEAHRAIFAEITRRAPAGEPVRPSEIVSLYETAEEQARAAEILSGSGAELDESITDEKTVREMIRAVTEGHIARLIANASTEEEYFAADLLARDYLKTRENRP